VSKREGFYNKEGYKYGKYSQSIEFIRQNGYDSFLRISDNWTGAYGRLE